MSGNHDRFETLQRRCVEFEQKIRNWKTWSTMALVALIFIGLVAVDLAPGGTWTGTWFVTGVAVAAIYTFVIWSMEQTLKQLHARDEPLIAKPTTTNSKTRIRRAIVPATIIFLLVLVVMLLVAQVNTSRLLTETRNGVWNCGDLAREYFDHRNKTGAWPPPGTYNNWSLRFMDSNRVLDQRHDRYFRGEKRDTIYTVSLHDDGLITVSIRTPDGDYAD